MRPEPDLTFGTFVQSPSSALAWAAALRSADGDRAFSPLVIYGPTGSGKTHLLNAIANAQPADYDAPKFTSAEDLSRQVIRAKRSDDMFNLLEEYGRAPIVIVDDIHKLSGLPKTEEQCVRVLRAAQAGGAIIVCAMKRHPSGATYLSESTQSFLQHGLCADMKSPDFQTARAIMAGFVDRMAHEPGAALIDDRVFDVVCRRIRPDGHRLRGAAIRLFAHTSLIGRQVAPDQAASILGDMMDTASNITIDLIRQKVCEHFGIRQNEIVSPRRERAIARPRQVAMFLCKDLTSKSFPEIGRQFGNRDHTTVIHACRKVAELMEDDDLRVHDDVNLLRLAIREAAGLPCPA